MNRNAVVMPDGLIVNIVDLDDFSGQIPDGATFVPDPTRDLRTGGTLIGGVFTPAPTTFEPVSFDDLDPREVFGALLESMYEENLMSGAKALAVRKRMIEKLKR